VAARENRLLALATGTLLPAGGVRRVASILTATVAAAVTAALLVGAIALVRNERQMGSLIALRIPTWVGQLALPAGFALIGVRLIGHASHRWVDAWPRSSGALRPVDRVVDAAPLEIAGLAGMVAILVAAVLGAPIFTVLGGAAAVLFLANEIPRPPS